MLEKKAKNIETKEQKIVYFYKLLIVLKVIKIIKNSTKYIYI